MFFSSAVNGTRAGQYGLMMKIARLADSENFTGIWTPERHFHRFGGIFPNPSITSAALAIVTQRIQLRAGSVIAPLHHPIRIAEDWSMIDNLSGGRVGISFGSGWNMNDFVLYPERFTHRRDIMYEDIRLIQRLWRGEVITLSNTLEKPIDIRLLPRPLQAHLPIWITSSGSRDTFVRAGEIGANILTHLIGQNITQLKLNIDSYRAARLEGNEHYATGTVSLMVHSYLDATVALATAKARPALKSYLRDAVELEYGAASGGGTVSGGRRAGEVEANSELLEELLDLSVDRYLGGQSLIGTYDSVASSIAEFQRCGVDELACLIDFGLSDQDVLSSIREIALLARRYGD